MHPIYKKEELRPTPERLILAALASALGVAAIASVRPLPSRDELPTPVPVGIVRPVTDARRVVGPEACVACHVQEAATWQASSHQAGARTLQLDADAQRIAAALGVRSVKSDARCAVCHFTVQIEADETTATVAGVSCESCHGPARDWIEHHGDFGAGVASAAAESTEHRALRLARGDDAGMHRVGDLVGLASRCYACHGPVGEELAGAGHPLGGELDLVSATQGELRHNFVRGGGTNALSDSERLRDMYVVGKLLDVEHAFLALARLRARGGVAPRIDPAMGAYASELVARAQAAVLELERIHAAAPTREVETALVRVRASELSPGANGLASAASAVHVCAQRFAARHDGESMTALDADIAALLAARKEPPAGADDGTH